MHSWTYLRRRMVMWMMVMRVVFWVRCPSATKNASTKLTKLWGIFRGVFRKKIEVTQWVTYWRAG